MDAPETKIVADSAMVSLLYPETNYRGLTKEEMMSNIFPHEKNIVVTPKTTATNVETKPKM